jgi:hypothetical protein
MLESKKLHLTSPESWTDKADKDFLKRYADGENVKVLCFFEGKEQNVHWERYAKCGCLVVFNKELLLKNILNNTKFRYQNVEYIKQANFKKYLKENPENLPFIKQSRYENENEYRIVWKGNNEKEAFIPLDDLNVIRRITISGDIDKKQSDSLKEIIRKICSENLEARITRSTLYDKKNF